MTMTVDQKLAAIAKSGWPIAYDGCHKMYFLQDDAREQAARAAGYEIHNSAEIQDLWDGSCGLRFVTRWGFGNDDFSHELNIEQFEDEVTEPTEPTLDQVRAAFEREKEHYRNAIDKVEALTVRGLAMFVLEQWPDAVYIELEDGDQSPTDVWARSLTDASGNELVEIDSDLPQYDELTDFTGWLDSTRMSDWAERGGTGPVYRIELRTAALLPVEL